MPLRRISAQMTGTLEEFYGGLATSEDRISAEVGAGMVDLITFLNANLRETIWALTSHYNLWLLSSDDYRGGWHVEVLTVGTEYRIRYRLPEQESPWDNALVEGIAKDKGQALEYILVAMQRSKGWPKQEEILTYPEIDEVLRPWAEGRSLFIATSHKDEDVRAVRLVDDQADSYMLAVFPTSGGKIFVNVSEDSVGKSVKRRRVLSLPTALPKQGDTLEIAYFAILGWICEKGHARTQV